MEQNVNPILEGVEICEAILGRPSQQFRTELERLQQRLNAVELQLQGLALISRAENQRKVMLQILAFFKTEIAPRTDWEEQHLFPAVDKRAAKNGEAFTSSLRYGHRIMARWIHALENETSLRYPDEIRFTQMTAQLLGLLKAHLEEEEEVLLPILDRTMTPQQFRDEIFGLRVQQ